MTILGFSDAKLTVYKRGGVDVRGQMMLCEHIGLRVCPRIYREHNDGYEMELLEPARYRGVVQMAEVVQKLRSEVWDRPEWLVPPAHGGPASRDWLWYLILWSTNAPWITKAISELYDVEPVDGYGLIHGDPALSNLMLRGEQLIITDPMPRLEYRREIPNRREVDMGKLVQSACGWERVLGCEGETLWNSPDAAMRMLPNEYRELAALWGAIHLARVAIRALPRGKSRIAEWATLQSQTLVRSYL